MSLQVWLPLNGNLNNQGLSMADVHNSGATVDSNGKIGSCYLVNNSNKIFFSSYPWMTMKPQYNFSCFFWVKGTTNGWLFACSAWEFMLRPSFIQVHLTGNGQYPARYTATFDTNTWYHLGFTWSGTEGKLRLYLNGSLVATSAVPSSASYDIASSFNIPYDGPRYINDFRLYDHCLSAKEVKEISKGLSLHYPMNDPYIEPTTNNYNGWSSNCYNGVTGKYNYGTSTDMYYDNLDGIIRVRMGTDNLDAWPFVFFNNITPPSNGEHRTLSFDYYPTIMDWINFYSYNTSGTITWISNGVKGSKGNIPVKLNSWNHISVTIKNTGSADSGFGYMKIGLEKHTSNTLNYWLFKNIQIESKDHSTGYTSAGTSRSESLCFDASGFGNNGVIRNQNSISIERDSPRYDVSTVFNGTPFIVGQKLDGAKSTDALSLCAWINPSQVSGGYNIISSYDSGGAGLHISSGNIYFQIYSGGYINVSGGSVSANTWYHVVGTYDNSKLRIYINGELKGEVAKTGNITYHSDTPWAVGVNPSGTGDGGEHYYGKLSDVRIYSTALSASDVKELYNTSASVDKNGNMYAYEFKEE